MELQGTRLAAFVDVVRGGPVQGATVADAVEVAWIAEAATESLRRGAWLLGVLNLAATTVTCLLAGLAGLACARAVLPR